MYLSKTVVAEGFHHVRLLLLQRGDAGAVVVDFLDVMLHARRHQLHLVDALLQLGGHALDQAPQLLLGSRCDRPKRPLLHYKTIFVCWAYIAI